MASQPRDMPKADAAPGRAEGVRGVVTAVASMHRGAEGAGRHADIVDRVFGPGGASHPEAGAEARASARPL